MAIAYDPVTRVVALMSDAPATPRMQLDPIGLRAAPPVCAELIE